MVAVAGFALSRPAGAGLVLAAAAAALSLPLLGVPLALGLVAYLACRWSKPHQILRGRTLSATAHRRAAAIAGIAVFGVVASFSALVAGLDLAVRLEYRLAAQIEAAERTGALGIGQTFRECERLACVRGTIVELPTRRTLGVARLAGLALHGERAFGWRARTLAAPSSPAPITDPAAMPIGPDRLSNALRSTSGF
ncbi:MAG TPA: hypothetical protein VFQ82_09735 [Stellaceae bacterium]|nr:hypothetical protein [Stellaceae bacterium]